MVAASEQIEANPVQLTVVQPVIQGVSTRTIWKFRIVDESKIPREYLSPNEVKLGAFARSTKGLVAVEGIEFYSQQIIGA